MSKYTTKTDKVAAVEMIEHRVRWLAEEEGFQITVSGFGNSQQPQHQTGWHWMIDHKGKRILDYWPVGEKYRIVATGERGTCDPLSLIRFACVLRGDYR